MQKLEASHSWGRGLPQHDDFEIREPIHWAKKPQGASWCQSPIEDTAFFEVMWCHERTSCNRTWVAVAVTTFARSSLITHRRSPKRSMAQQQRGLRADVWLGGLVLKKLSWPYAVSGKPLTFFGALVSPLNMNRLKKQGNLCFQGNWGSQWQTRRVTHKCLITSGWVMKSSTLCPRKINIFGGTR